jgi:hypothetical protein
MTRDRPSLPPSRLPVPPANAAPSEESLLSPQLKAAWRQAVTPQRADRARIWSELAKATRGAVASSTVDRVERAMAVRALGAPALRLPYALSAKWLLPSALLSGAFAVAWLQRPAQPLAAPRQESRHEAAVAPRRDVPAPSAPTPSAPPAQPVGRPQLASHRRHAKSVSAAPLSAPAFPAAPAAPAVAEPVVPEPPRLDLAGDLKLLQRAAAALASNDPAGAIRLLDRPGALQADSPLSKEKTALRIMAGCALAEPQARNERDNFLRAEQHSPLGERVRAACAGLR